MAKYDPLYSHLSKISSEVMHVRLSFGEVEGILRAALPASARGHDAWWANETEGNHVQARAWMEAGWRVGDKSFTGEWVVFRRVG